MPIQLAVAGAAGRMGRQIIALADRDARFALAAALERSSHPSLGKDAGELAGIAANDVPIADAAAGSFDVLIDFSAASGTRHWLTTCLERGKAIVIGTTGHGHDDLAAVRDAAQTIPVLKAANMSVGVNVLLRITRDVAQILDASYDVEISESHHRFKVDAPSGTALAVRDAVIEGRRAAGAGDQPVVHGREGHTGERAAGEIGMHSLRIGDTVGDHTVAFGTLGEVITLGHSAHSRETFATGALRAAAWISDRPPGLYDMQDVLFGTA